MDECSSSHLDARQPSPVSILETSFSTESCNSSDSMDSYSIDGKATDLSYKFVTKSML